MVDTSIKNGKGLLDFMSQAEIKAFCNGAASTGRARVLEVEPERLHQRVPVIAGSRAEVEPIARYHTEFDRGEDQPFRSPLFGERSLFTNA